MSRRKTNILCVFPHWEKLKTYTETFKGDTKSMAQYRNLFIPHSTFTAWLEGSAHGIKHTLGYQICSMHTAGVRKMRGGMALKSVIKRLCLYFLLKLSFSLSQPVSQSVSIKKNYFSARYRGVHPSYASRMLKLLKHKASHIQQTCHCHA